MGTQTAPTPTLTTGLRKAAILMLSLGEDAAAEVFKHLREDDIEQLTREISMIGIIQPTEKDTILEEFYTLSMAKSYVAEGGVEYAKAILAKLFTVIAPRMKERNGGYTRIVRIGMRKLDAADMVILELVDHAEDGKKAEREKRRAEKKAKAKSKTAAADKA